MLKNQKLKEIGQEKTLAKESRLVKGSGVKARSILED